MRNFARCEPLERRRLLSVAPEAPLAFVNKPDFSDVSDMTLNGSATNADTGGRLRLTDAVDGQAGSAFFNDPFHLRWWAGPVSNGFTAEFDVKVTPGTGDPGEGFLFVLHNDPLGPGALGSGGQGMGWEGLQNSFGVKFDFSSPGGSQTGVYSRGEAVSSDPADPHNRVIPDRFDFASGKMLHVLLDYDAAEKRMTEIIRDPADPAAELFFTNYDVDIPAAVEAEPVYDAYVGFTAATRDASVAGAADGNARQEVLNFRYGIYHWDVFGPRVTQVFVNGQGMTGQTSVNGIAFRGLGAIDNNYGYPVPAGPNQTKSIPWSNGVNKIALRFDVDASATLGQDDLVVRGVNRANYPISDFTYDPATRTGTWTLATPAVNDKLRLVLDDAVVTGLDGDWTTGQAYPSGDGAPGGDFNFRINVLRGDVNQDGVINAPDLGGLKQRQNRTASNPGFGRTGYSVFADLNADGMINVLDLGLAKARLNNSLPAGEPAAPW